MENATCSLCPLVTVKSITRAKENTLGNFLAAQMLIMIKRRIAQLLYSNVCCVVFLVGQRLNRSYRSTCRACRKVLSFGYMTAKTES